MASVEGERAEVLRVPARKCRKRNGFGPFAFLISLRRAIDFICLYTKSGVGEGAE